MLAKLKDYASISEIENAIDTHPAFSVKNSNVKVRNSGIFTQEEIKNIDGLPNTYPNNLAKDDLEKTIPDYFLSAGANAITNKDPNIPGVYYDDVNNEYDSQTILHESIHFATGLNDVDLANALGLKNSEGKTFEKDDYRNASRAIKEAIYANCPSSFF